MKKILTFAAILFVTAIVMSSCYSKKPPCPAYMSADKVEQVEQALDLDRA